METILICDDESDIRRILNIYLSGEGYRILEAEDGQRALEVMESESVQLVLMDIMMPVMDGVEATRRMRETSSVPVILLTAKSEDADNITKPFNPLEVIARVRAQLRRASWGAPPADEPGHLRCGGLEMDDNAKRVTAEGAEVSLTPTEYDILKLLMERPGHVLSTAELYRSVWNEPPQGAENVVPVHIRHLREKIEIDPANPRYIKVVWGKGYKLEAES